MTPKPLQKARIITQIIALCLLCTIILPAITYIPGASKFVDKLFLSFVDAVPATSVSAQLVATFIETDKDFEKSLSEILLLVFKSFFQSFADCIVIGIFIGVFDKMFGTSACIVSVFIGTLLGMLLLAPLHAAGPGLLVIAIIFVGVLIMLGVKKILKKAWTLVLLPMIPSAFKAGVGILYIGLLRVCADSGMPTPVKFFLITLMIFGFSFIIIGLSLMEDYWKKMKEEQEKARW